MNCQDRKSGLALVYGETSQFNEKFAKKTWDLIGPRNFRSTATTRILVLMQKKIKNILILSLPLKFPMKFNQSAASKNVLGKRVTNV